MINDRTRREYRRLLVKCALAYFARDAKAVDDNLDAALDHATEVGTADDILP